MKQLLNMANISLCPRNDAP